jgi:predicted Na+-dependent transporter
MTPPLLLLLKASVGAIIFAIGMDATPADATYLWRRPALLGRSLLAMYVAVPLAALLMVRLLALPPGVEAALLVLAVSAGAPLLPKKLLPVGNGAYTFSLVVTSSLMAIVLVPAWLALLGPLFGGSVDLDPTRVAWLLAKGFFIPLVAGMAVRAVAPRLAEAIAEKVILGAGVVLSVGAVALLAMNLGVLAAVRWPGVLALVALLAIALAIGHLFGGPTEDDRTTLAVASATRHLGIALIVAASLPGPRTAVMVAVYFITAAAVTIPYLRWRRGAHSGPTSRMEQT